MTVHTPKGTDTTPQDSLSSIVVDLDGTLTIPSSAASYADMEPNSAVIARLLEYRATGMGIAIYTARNMRTYGNSVGKINAHTLPVVIDWLRRHGIPFDEVHVGKPWCGPNGFYIDDSAVRPAEFASLAAPEIARLLGRNRD